jgi:ATP-dependent RNA helicase RhlB
VLRKEQPESAIIFCNTKRFVEILARRLRHNGFRCDFISGDLPQKKRLQIIDELKAGRNHFLVATDVAARGLDIENLSMVVNYDLPTEAENYVHRIGRTARAGANGKAVSFASDQDVYELLGIERFVGNKIPSQVACDEDYGEDKEGSRDDYGREGRRRPSNRTRPSSRQGQRSREESASERPGAAAGAKHGKKQSRGGQGQRRQRPYISHEELSRMTLEERKAYYKQKYDGEGGDELDKTLGAPASRQAAQKRGTPAGKGKKAQTGQGLVEGRTPRGKKKPFPEQRNRKQGGKPSSADSAKAAGAKGASKPGILARIAAKLFGKKT